MTDLAKLREPFPPDRISWRVGSTTADKTRGMALAYIDARDVQDRLDAVCGPSGWQCSYPHANDKKTVCTIGIYCPVGEGHAWIWKADGAGDTDFEAEKGALSDAFKRAAVRWGIGRYLYDVDAPWVAIKAAGKSFKIEDSELPRLRALLAGKAPKFPPAEIAALKQAEKELGNPNGDVANGVAKPDPKQAAAVAWAEDAIPYIRKISDSKSFDAWHKENRERVARIKNYNAKLHLRLTDAIGAKLDVFNPVGA